MLRVLRQRNFGLLWVGGLISMIGDWVLFVGLPFEIYRLTGSTLAVSASCSNSLASDGLNFPRTLTS